MLSAALFASRLLGICLIPETGGAVYFSEMHGIDGITTKWKVERLVDASPGRRTYSIGRIYTDHCDAVLDWSLQCRIIRPTCFKPWSGLS